MPEKIITIYCFFDELLKALNHRDDPQAKLTTAEIMTIAIVAAQFYTGNQQKALDFLTSHGYIRPFSKSRFNRRLHAIPEALWQLALSVLAQIHQQSNPEREHIVDTFPVPVCRNIRIKRCRIYKGEAFRGYCASKKEQLDGCLAYICRRCRKRVETTFSLLAERLARSIHVVTPRGFELKAMLT